MSEASDMRAVQQSIADLLSRVQSLEDEVFKGGPPGLGERVLAVEQALQEVRSETNQSVRQLRSRLDKAIEVLAQLRKQIEQGGQATAGF